MKIKIFIAVSLVATFVFSSCYNNPITGRSTLNLVDESTLNTMAAQQYQEFLATNPPNSNSPEGIMVRQVGQELSAAVTNYLAKINQLKIIRGYNWEFNYVNNPEANAWCMPGGKVAVYSGIMPIAKTKAGLAVVMGHEIAHAIAQHGNERMSQGLLQQAGGVALSVAVASKSTQTQQLYSQAYGIGSNVGAILPFSRKDESEADRMGLIFMALAGYNPNEAVDFWQRMAANSKGAPPEFLSTHPSNATRIQDLRNAIPEAMKYYKKP